MRANFVAFANALCHRNATPLSVVVLAPCAWGENLACGVAWQSVVNLATHNTAWRGEFDNETAQHSKFQRQSKHSEFSVANLCGQNGARQIRLGKCGSACGQSRQSENGAVFGRGISLSLSLSLSLSRCSHFLHAFGLNLKGFFTHFIVVLTHLFAYKRHFLGHCAFFEIFKCFVFGLLRPFCHFEPFAKRRPNGLQGASRSKKIHTN